MVQAYQEGKFLADPESRGKPRPNPMSDPAAMEGMMGMMKGNMAMMIPQSLIMGWINAFFSGFVISKSILFLWCVVMHVSLQALLLGSTIECSLELLRRYPLAGRGCSSPEHIGLIRLVTPHPLGRFTGRQPLGLRGLRHSLCFLEELLHPGGYTPVATVPTTIWSKPQRRAE
jgi:hypothetical protein